MMRMNRRVFCAGLTALGACATTKAPLLAGHAIGIQMYALGPDASKDLDATFGALATIGYKEVEVLQGAKPAADVSAALAHAGLACPSMHIAVGAANTPDAIARAAEYAHAVGARYACTTIFPFVKPLPPVANPADMLGALAHSYTQDDWKRVADILNTTAHQVQSAGLAYAYHNHNPEFGPVGDTTGIDILIANTDPDLVKFEVDVGWVGAAGLDVAAYLRRVSGRVRLVHVKDYKATTQPNFAIRMDSTEVGNGVQNWPAILSAAKDAGAEHFLVEQEPPFVRAPLESAKISYDFLRRVA